MVIDNYKKLLYLDREDRDRIFLLEVGELSEWERKFLKSIKKSKEISEKQRDALDRIYERYLK